MHCLWLLTDERSKQREKFSESSWISNLLPKAPEKREFIMTRYSLDSYQYFIIPMECLPVLILTARKIRGEGRTIDFDGVTAGTWCLFTQQCGEEGRRAAHV